MSIRRSVPIRRPALLAMLLAAVVVILGSAVPALAADSLPGPSPFAPDDAQALATATAAVPSGSSTTAVDGQTALDASTLPGAATSVEAGVSTQAAVGLAPLNDSDGGSNIASVPATRASLLGQPGVASVGNVAVPAEDHRHDVLVRRLRQAHHLPHLDHDGVRHALRRELAGERTDRRRSRTGLHVLHQPRLGRLLAARPPSPGSRSTPRITSTRSEPIAA